MPAIGPALPPHLLAKKKRQREEAEAAAKESPLSSDSIRSNTPDGGEKKRRVIGPAMPPAPLEEKPRIPPSPPQKPTNNDDDESSDDDFGPAVPSGAEAESTSTFDHMSNDAKEPQEIVRQRKHDDWMMNPPEQDGLAAQMDPMKRRPTKFGSGKPSGPTDSSIWHETPEQKRKRLENEVLGIKETPSLSESTSRVSTRNNEETRKKIDEYNRKSRGKSLYEMHDVKRKKEDKVDEDDPSKRAFNREKDIGGGTLNFTQRKEMLSRASNFGSRFSGGGFL